MYYKDDNETDVADFLGEVHKKLNARYNLDQKNKQQLGRAKNMTSFLQKLKNYSLDLPNKYIDKRDEAFIKTVFSLLPPTIPKDLIFQRKKGEDSQATGDRFELELAEVFHIIATGIPSGGVSQIKVGTETAISSKDMDKFLKDNFRVIEVDNNAVTKSDMKLTEELEHNLPKYIKKAICELLPERYKKIDSLNPPKGIEYQFLMSDVQAKTDLSHQRINITKTWNISEEAQSALQDIQSANFSAKSYTKDKYIKIGTTNAIRAYFSVLEGLRDSSINNYRTKASSFLHAVALVNVKNKKINNREERAKKVERYVYQMRFVYELMGLGQKGSKDLPELIKTDYLLYNENNGKNIYVFPTKTILKVMYDQIDNTERGYDKKDPFKAEVTINKTWVDKLKNLVKSEE